MFLKPYQIEDISQIKVAGSRGLEVDIYNDHISDRQTSNGNEMKFYTYLNRPLRQAQDSPAGGIHLLHPTIESQDRMIPERLWNGQQRDGKFTEFGPQGWNYNRQNIPNAIINKDKLREHNEKYIQYSEQEEKDLFNDSRRYQDRIHIVNAMDRVIAEQGTGDIYSPPEMDMRNYIDRRSTQDSSTKSEPTDRIFPMPDYTDSIIPRGIENFEFDGNTGYGTRSDQSTYNRGYYGGSDSSYAKMGKPCEYDNFPQSVTSIPIQNIKPSKEFFAYLDDRLEVKKYHQTLIAMGLLCLGFVIFLNLKK
jgi:hypothetical protein